MCDSWTLESLVDAWEHWLYYAIQSPSHSARSRRPPEAEVRETPLSKQEDRLLLLQQRTWKEEAGTGFEKCSLNLQYAVARRPPNK